MLISIILDIVISVVICIFTYKLSYGLFGSRVISYSLLFIVSLYVCFAYIVSVPRYSNSSLDYIESNPVVVYKHEISNVVKYTTDSVATFEKIYKRNIFNQIVDSTYVIVK
jgi:hypothetical protein